MTSPLPEPTEQGAKKE